MSKSEEKTREEVQDFSVAFGNISYRYVLVVAFKWPRSNRMDRCISWQHGGIALVKGIHWQSGLKGKYD